MSGWRLPLALVSGLLLALAFPGFNLPDVAWVALAPLLVAVIGARPGYGFFLGFVQGAVFYGVTLAWLDSFLRGYGGMSALVAGALLGLMVGVLSLYTAGFALGIAFLSRRSVTAAVVCAPFLWVALELLRTDVPVLGFPWNLAGYAAAAHLGLLQLATLTGIYGLSSIIVAYNALLAWALLERDASAVIGCAIVTTGLVLALVLGGRLVPRPAPNRVAYLVQTNLVPQIDYPHDWLETHARTLDELEALSAKAARAKPGLVVWPEVPAPFSLKDPQFAVRAERIAQSSREGFLVGVDDWKPTRKGRMDASNSAVLLDNTGDRLFAYDKIHLVPFGEYVPWRHWLFFARKLTGGLGDYTPGKGVRVGELPGGRFGVFICYEAIFPAEVREFVARGAELLINISDDGWYGHTPALAQHMHMARVRAVENRRWLLRDTNTGLTAVVDPYGRIVAQLRPDTRAVLAAPYAYRNDRTLFARWGNWFAWLCTIAAAELLVAGGVTGAKKQAEKRSKAG